MQVTFFTKINCWCYCLCYAILEDLCNNLDARLIQMLLLLLLLLLLFLIWIAMMLLIVYTFFEDLSQCCCQSDSNIAVVVVVDAVVVGVAVAVVDRDRWLFASWRQQQRRFRWRKTRPNLFVSIRLNFTNCIFLPICNVTLYLSIKLALIQWKVCFCVNC